MLDPRIELANTHDIHDRWGAMNFAANARKTAQNYENQRNFNGGGVQFRPDHMEEESGVCSPPLWKTSPSRSLLHSRHPQNNYSYLSPTARAQAVAKGQWELMEMVKNMPESSYELSLRDLVEQTKVGAQEEKCLIEEKNFGNEIVNRRMNVKRQESKKIEKKVKMGRNESFENSGLFLKMVFPISFGSKKKKNSAINTCAKVSPKPEASDKSSKGVDREWWKKKFSVSGDSESIATGSNNSGSTGSSSSSRSNSSSRRSNSSSRRSNSSRKRSTGFLSGCWPIFCSPKSKSAK